MKTLNRNASVVNFPPGTTFGEISTYIRMGCGEQNFKAHTISLRIKILKIKVENNLILFFMEE
jgi:hypothetical protein